MIPCFLVRTLFLYFGIYSEVNPYDVRITKLTPIARYKLPQSVGHGLFKMCYYNNKWVQCPSALQYGPHYETLNIRRIHSHVLKFPFSRLHLERAIAPVPVSLKGMIDDTIPSSTIYNISPFHYYDHNNEIHKNKTNIFLSQQRKFNYQVTTPTYTTVHKTFTHSLDDSIMTTAYEKSNINNQNNINTKPAKIQESEKSSEDFADIFFKSLNRFERVFYQVTFNKLTAISPLNRQENGISFIQSALFLYLALMAISTEVDQSTKLEIEKCLGYNASQMEEIKMLRHIISWLPNSNMDIKFRWASRLVLSAGLPVSQQFVNNVAPAAQLSVRRFNGTETPIVLSKSLNSMIEEDSGGAMRDTFEVEEMSGGVCSILLNTMYIRARWRSPPTVLNGTRRFYYASKATPSSVRMIRINDIMRYCPLDEWNADAIEINYATPDLSLMLLVPRGHSIRSLAEIMSNKSIQDLNKNMRTMRIAATMPIYTLRMTLLLPGKLKTMGTSRLVEMNNSSGCDEIRLSHAVQRLMFWAEAGKHAYKDDGIEWDETPELEIVLDRPYIFYVRWKNVTLMNGNFVL
ncbi:antichymotrypsin-2-like [Nymphalis io]|uniref:antichymotrypsin-2-like n=1 Tax=Inachis io TaxID=171585 RepID=UPI00216921E9|nr:antichymotrypsin-2-like [Nymphalis io]